MRDKGKNKSAYMAPQGIIGRQEVSRPLVIRELDITVNSRWLYKADYIFIKA
jgi:hypothetical protein